MLFLKFVTFHFFLEMTNQDYHAFPLICNFSLFSRNDKSVFSNVEICAVFKFSVLQNNLKSKEVDSTKIPQVISGSCCGHFQRHIVALSPPREFQRASAP